MLRLNSPMTRTAPFLVFLGFIGIEEVLQSIHTSVFLPQLILYPVKACIVAFLLLFFRTTYDEIRLKDLLKTDHAITAIAAGMMVFLIWINMDWMQAAERSSSGFNPDLLQDNVLRSMLIGVRLTGAVIVVPLMEELFWRSFLHRYLISSAWDTVPIGRFTWPSFLITTILFGLEHHLFVAGLLAGAIYNLILYRYKSIAICVLAHGVTNLALSIYVLDTGQWHFW